MRPLNAEYTLPQVFKDLIQKIYDRDVKAGDIDPDTAVHMALDYMDAVYQGTGLNFTSVDYNTPDYELLANMEKSVYRFSAAKSYHENKALTALLTQGDKHISFAEFDKLAQKQLGITIGKYGKVEYNAAVSSGQLAAKWQRFTAKAHVLPYLQFLTSAADKVCDICHPFDGMIRKIDDPIWHQASPLLHFNCYCDILQLPDREGEIEETPEKDIPTTAQIPEIFRVNYAEKQQAFPPGHPYYDGVPLKKINSFVNKFKPDRDGIE